MGARRVLLVLDSEPLNSLPQRSNSSRSSKGLNVEGVPLSALVNVTVAPRGPPAPRSGFALTAWFLLPLDAVTVVPFIWSNSASARSKLSICACSCAAFLNVDDRHFIPALLSFIRVRNRGGGLGVA